MRIKKAIYGLATLGCMYGASASFNQGNKLVNESNTILNTQNINRVKELYPEFDERHKISLLNQRDFKGLAKICSELDSLKQEGTFEEIQRGTTLKNIGIGYSATSVFSGFASLVLAGLSLGYLRRENKFWVIGKRKAKEEIK